MSPRIQNRALLCHLTSEQYEYVLTYAERYRISMSAAVVRLIRLARIVEQWPDASEIDKQRVRK